MPLFLPGKLPFFVALTLIVAGVILLFFASFGSLSSRADSVSDGLSPIALVDTMRRENNRLRQTMEGIADSLGGSHAEVKTALQDLSAMQEQVRELRKERAALNVVAENWQRRVIDYLRDLDRASRNDGLSDSARTVMQRDFDELARKLAPLGLAVIRPEPNELFDDRVHQSAAEESASGIAFGRVVRCERFGFQLGDQVPFKAEVVVSAR